MSKWLVLALMAISATVAIRLVKKKTAWELICLYWIVLTAKNIVDLMGW